MKTPLKQITIDTNVQPLISIIIPTYRRNDLLASCLDRLAPGVQTLPEQQYEVVVTDDGPENQNAQAMVAARYPWARWTAGPGRGPAANRNHGVCVAQGEWLAFTDDDCLPSAGWLEAFVQAITPGVSVYEGKTTCETGIASPLEHAPINEEGGWLWSCNMMLSRKAFDDLGGFDEGFPHPHMEDVDVRERLKEKGYTFPFLKDAVVDHPPRRVSWKKMAASHESEVMYWYKSGNHSSYSSRLIYEMVRARLVSISERRLKKDALLAVAFAVLELAYVLPRINSWQHKYQSRYQI